MLRDFIIRVYERNHGIRNIALVLGLTSSTGISSLKSSRTVEYPWLFRNLDTPRSYNRLLDVGSVGSTLPIALASQGYAVWSIDVRRHEYANLVRNVRFLVGDMRKTDFEEGYFDCVVAVSTLEHMGLGRYDKKGDSDDDYVSIKEFLRVLSTNGVLLFTVPYGRSEVYPSHRVYDEQRLNRLLEGFEVEQADYFIRNREGFWQPCSKKDLTNTISPVVENGLACVKSRKM